MKKEVESIPFLYEERFYHYQNADIKYAVGDGTSDITLLFIPGWAGIMDFWYMQLGFFNVCRYHIIAIDYPGFARATLDYRKPDPDSPSSQGTNFDHGLSMDHQAALIAGILRREHVKSCILIGHSMGGALALTVAAQNPDIVQSVIGVDSLTYMELYPAVPENTIKSFTEGFKTDFKGTMQTIVDSYITKDTSDETKEFIFEMMSSAHPERAIIILEEFLRWDLGKYLDIYKGPVNVIVAHDTYDAEAFVPRFGDRISVMGVRDAGHFLMIEKPYIVNDYMLEIFENIENFKDWYSDHELVIEWLNGRGLD